MARGIWICGTCVGMKSYYRMCALWVPSTSLWHIDTNLLYCKGGGVTMQHSHNTLTTL